jgi:hypothetical protein
MEAIMEPAELQAFLNDLDNSLHLLWLELTPE